MKRAKAAAKVVTQGTGRRFVHVRGFTYQGMQEACVDCPNGARDLEEALPDVKVIGEFADPSRIAYPIVPLDRYVEHVINDARTWEQIADMNTPEHVKKALEQRAQIEALAKERVRLTAELRKRNLPKIKAWRDARLANERAAEEAKRAAEEAAKRKAKIAKRKAKAAADAAAAVETERRDRMARQAKARDAFTRII